MTPDQRLEMVRGFLEGKRTFAQCFADTNLMLHLRALGYDLRGFNDEWSLWVPNHGAMACRSVDDLRHFFNS